MTTRPRIAVLTRTFPWLPGEEFIDTEAQYWGQWDADLTVMPWWRGRTVRPVPTGITVDDTLARRPRSRVAAATVAALGHPLLWGELLTLMRSRRLSPETTRSSIAVVRGTLLATWSLRRWIRRHGPIDVVYGYWLDVWTLGALRLRGRGVGAVVSRVHGYDIHEERAVGGHLPLRRRLAPALDALLPVSAEGAELAQERFGVRPEAIHVSPLGVEIPVELCPPSEDGVVRVLSLSSLVEVKRVDRIARALVYWTGRHRDRRVEWTHIGDGPTLGTVRDALVAAPDNLVASLPGALAHDVVLRSVHDGPFDVIVNASSSEGIPVSLMEAMASGVPAVAPDVGAIGELVTSGVSGVLVPDTCTPAELSVALDEVLVAGAPMRRAARQEVVERYDARRNAADVMVVLGRLAGGRR